MPNIHSPLKKPLTFWQSLHSGFAFTLLWIPLVNMAPLDQASLHLGPPGLSRCQLHRPFPRASLVWEEHPRAVPVTAEDSPLSLRAWLSSPPLVFNKYELTLEAHTIKKLFPLSTVFQHQRGWCCQKAAYNPQMTQDGCLSTICQLHLASVPVRRYQQLSEGGRNSTGTYILALYVTDPHSRPATSWSSKHSQENSLNTEPVAVTENHWVWPKPKQIIDIFLAAWG